jgi:LPS sulfotransferase NodH
MRDALETVSSASRHAPYIDLTHSSERGRLLIVEPVRSYVICCVQRTGSWLLAHTLADTQYAGRPSDYFDEAERKNHAREWGLPAGDLTAYIHAVRKNATTPNGVLGSKMMWNDFDWLRSSSCPPAGTDPGLAFMQKAFPDPQFIWLRREDKVRRRAM